MHTIFENLLSIEMYTFCILSKMYHIASLNAFNFCIHFRFITCLLPYGPPDTNPSTTQYSHAADGNPTRKENNQNFNFLLLTSQPEVNFL